MGTSALLKLNADGTAEVSMINTKIRLRRPTLGEYIELRETLEADEERAAEVQERVTLAVLAGRAFTGEARLTPEAGAAAKEIRAATREARDEAERLRLDFFRAVIAKLDVKKGTLDEDNIPPEVFGDEWVGDLIEHWRSRPTVPGDQ